MKPVFPIAYDLSPFESGKNINDAPRVIDGKSGWLDETGYSFCVQSNRLKTRRANAQMSHTQVKTWNEMCQLCPLNTRQSHKAYCA